MERIHFSVRPQNAAANSHVRNFRFIKKLDKIAEEAEAVAFDLAGGKEMSAREQQDLMWEKGSVSVWDLEQIEEQAESEGKVTVWSDEGQRSIAQEEEMRRNALLRDQQGN